MSKKILKKTLSGVFNTGQWKSLPDTTFVQNGINQVNLRGWQNDVLELRKNSSRPHLFLNCPTGAGKSKAGLAIITHDEKNTKNLVIISAPQKEIGKGFLSSTGIPQNILGHTWVIDPKNQLCENSSINEDGNVARVMELLKSHRFADLNNRIVICCHATLALLFDRMTDDEKEMYLKDIKLCIDESHHSLSQEESGNGLGNVVRYFLDNNDKNLNLIMMTATPFRGDKGALIPDKYLDQFCRYDLDYGRHFEENCNGLEFVYNAVLHQYGNEYIKVLSDLFERHLDRNDKVLVQIPPSNHKISNGKNNDLQMVYDSIGKNQTVDANGIVLIKRGNDYIRVLDLITEKNRAARLDYLRKNPTLIDVVIGIALIKEGFDWPPANVGILIGPQGSLNAQIQLMGRMFRAYDNKGKNNGQRPVEISQIYPYVDHEQLDEDAVREQINDFMKIVYAALAMELAINPIHIEIPVKTDDDGKPTQRKTVKNFLTESLTDTQYHELIANVMDEYRDWKAVADDSDDVVNAVKIAAKISEIVSTKLTELGIDENHVEVAEFINKTFQRKAKFELAAAKGIDVSHIDLQLMADIDDPIDSILMGMSNGLCGAKDIKEFQLLMKPVDSIRRCYELKSWVEKKSNNPNINSKDPIERSLANFMSQCKFAYRNGSNSKSLNLTPEHIQILESIENWDWSYRDATSERIDELEIFLSENKKYPSLTSSNDNEKSLAVFIGNVKKSYNGKSASYILSAAHIERFGNLEGWSWDNRNDKNIKQAHIIYNYFLSNSELPDHDSKLAQIVKRFRKNYKKGMLSDECIEILNKIPNFKWQRDVDLYINKAIELVQWMQTNDKLPNSKSDDLLERRMGQYAGLFRQAYKKQGKLKINDKHINILDSCKLWKWDAKRYFIDSLHSLKSWCQLNNKLPSDSGDKLELTHWRVWRKCMKDGKHAFNEDEVSILESIEFFSWIEKDDLEIRIYDMIKWIGENVKIPTHGSKDKIERSFGYFRKDLKTKYRNNKLDSKYIFIINNKISNWEW